MRGKLPTPHRCYHVAYYVSFRLLNENKRKSIKPYRGRHAAGEAAAPLRLVVVGVGGVDGGVGVDVVGAPVGEGPVGDRRAPDGSNLRVDRTLAGGK